MTNSCGNGTPCHLKPPTRVLWQLLSYNALGECFSKAKAIQPHIIYLITILRFQQMPKWPPAVIWTSQFVADHSPLACEERGFFSFLIHYFN